MTYADRTAPSRVAVVLRAKATAILADMAGGPRADEFTPYELLELANAIDPAHRVSFTDARAAATRAAAARPRGRR